MKKWIKNNIFSIIFLPAMILIFLKFRESKDASYFSYFFLVLAIIPLNNLLPNWKIFKPFKFILELIIGIILLIGPIYKSVFIIFISVLFPIALIALLIKYTPEYIFGIDLNFSTKVYLFLISSTSLLTFYIKGILTKFNSLYGSNGTPEEKQAQLELTFSLANKNRIRFLIYLAFLFYLFFFSINKLNKFNLFENSGIDMAVFYSFITFIALERVSHNLDLMNYKPRKFFKKAIASWRSLGYFDEIDKKEENEIESKSEKSL